MSRKISIDQDHIEHLNVKKARYISAQEISSQYAKDLAATTKNTSGLDFVIPANMSPDDDDPTLSIIYQPGGYGVKLTRQVYQLVEIRIPAKYLTLRNREVFSRHLWGGELPKEIRSHFPYVTPPNSIPISVNATSGATASHQASNISNAGIISGLGISNATGVGSNASIGASGGRVGSTSLPSPGSSSSLSTSSVTSFSSAPDYCLSQNLYTDDSDVVAILHHTNHITLQSTPPAYLGLSAIFRILPNAPYYPSLKSGSYISRSSPSAGTSSSATGLGSSHKYTLQLVRTERIEKGSLIQAYTRKKPLQTNRRFRDIRLASMHCVNERIPISLRYHALRTRRNYIPDITIVYTQDGTPAYKYHLGIITDHGISPEQWGSSRLLNSRLIFEAVPSKRPTISAGVVGATRSLFPVAEVIEDGLRDVIIRKKNHRDRDGKKDEGNTMGVHGDEDEDDINTIDNDLYDENGYSTYPAGFTASGLVLPILKFELEKYVDIENGIKKWFLRWSLISTTRSVTTSQTDANIKMLLSTQSDYYQQHSQNDQQSPNNTLHQMQSSLHSLKSLQNITMPKSVIKSYPVMLTNSTMKKINATLLENDNCELELDSSETGTINNIITNDVANDTQASKKDKDIYMQYMNAMAELLSDCNTNANEDEFLQSINLDIDNDNESGIGNTVKSKNITEKGISMNVNACKLALSHEIDYRLINPTATTTSGRDNQDDILNIETTPLSQNPIDSIPNPRFVTISQLNAVQETKIVLEDKLLWSDLLWAESSLVIRGKSYGALLNLRIVPVDNKPQVM